MKRDVKKKREKEEEEAGAKHTPSIQKRIMHNIGTLQELLTPISD
jgi:hypothetical protein